MSSNNSFKSPPCLITTVPDEVSIFSVGPLQIWEGCHEVSSQLSLLQAEQPRPSEPVFIREVAAVLLSACCREGHTLEQFHILKFEAPELDARTRGKQERQNPLPGPAALDAT